MEDLAANLFLGSRTVDRRLSSIKSRLDARKSRVRLGIQAVSHRWVDPDEVVAAAAVRIGGRTWTEPTPRQRKILQLLANADLSADEATRHLEISSWTLRYDLAGLARVNGAVSHVGLGALGAALRFH